VSTYFGHRTRRLSRMMPRTHGSVQVRHLPVLQDGQVVGMVSDRRLSIVMGRSSSPTTSSRAMAIRKTRIPMQVRASCPPRVVSGDGLGCRRDRRHDAWNTGISALPSPTEAAHRVITTIDMLQCFLDCCEKQPYCRSSRQRCGTHERTAGGCQNWVTMLKLSWPSMVRTQSYYALVVRDDRLVGIISDRD